VFSNKDNSVFFSTIIIEVIK